MDVTTIQNASFLALRGLCQVLHVFLHCVSYTAHLQDFPRLFCKLHKVYSRMCDLFCTQAVDECEANGVCVFLVKHSCFGYLCVCAYVFLHLAEHCYKFIIFKLSTLLILQEIK